MHLETEKQTAYSDVQKWANMRERVLCLHVTVGWCSAAAGIKVWACLNYTFLLLGADFLEQEIWPRAVLQLC